MAEVYRATIPKGTLAQTAGASERGKLVETADQATALAHKLNEEGKPQEAISLFRTALGLDETHEGAAVELALTYQDTGQHREAISVLEDFLDRRPDAQKPRLCLAGILSRQGDLAGASREYERCLGADPSWAEPYVPLVAVLCRQGRFAEARGQLVAYKLLSPDPRSVEMLEKLLNRTRGN